VGQLRGEGQTASGATYRAEREELVAIARDYAGKDEDVVRGANARVQALTDAHLQDIVGAWAGALQQLAGMIHGTVGETLGVAANALQAGMSLASQVESALSKTKFGQSSVGGGGGATWAGALGEVAGVFAIFAAIYEGVSAHIKKVKSQHYGNVGDYNITGGGEGRSYVDQQSMESTDAIAAAVRAFGDALGGTVTELQKISIRVRNDGKYVAAYVGDEMIGHFNDINSAIMAAINEEVRRGTISLSGISDLVKQAMGEWRSPDVSQMMDFFAQMREIADLGKTQGAISMESTVQHFDQLWHALEQLDHATPAVIQGFANLTSAELSSWEAWRRQITGTQETRQQQMQDRQREADMFNAQKRLRIAELQLQEIDLKSQLQALIAKGRIAQGNAHIDHDQLNLEAQVLQARAGLLGDEADLAGVQVDLYNAQIAAIQAALDAIGKLIDGLEHIPDIKPPDIHFGGGGSGQSRDDRLVQALSPVFSMIENDRQLSKKYQAELIAFRRLELKIEELKIEAELRALGVWQQYAALVTDVFQHASDAAGKPGALGGAAVAGRTSRRRRTSRRWCATARASAR
jgi:hypothetical protein